MSFARNRGLRIHCEVQGHGPALVLHHGFSENLTTGYGKGFVEALKTEYQLILFDARGHGASGKPLIQSDRSNPHFRIGIGNFKRLVLG